MNFIIMGIKGVKAFFYQRRNNVGGAGVKIVAGTIKINRK
jgi:hypothetical protein